MKLRLQIIVIAVIGAYFLLNGLIPREEKWKEDSKNLQEIGYSVEASNHIAKIENGLLPIDDFYLGLIED